MYFKDKLDSTNAYSMQKCIHSFWQYFQKSCNIARIATKLPEFPQYYQNSDNTNLHAKSSIAATLQQYCGNIARNCYCNIAAILPQYCGSILPEGLYYDKASVLTNNFSFWDGSYEYPQHKLWLRNRKVIF